MQLNRIKKIACLLLVLLFTFSIIGCNGNKTSILDDTDIGAGNDDYGYNDDASGNQGGNGGSVDKDDDSTVSKPIVNDDGYDPYAKLKDEVKGKTVRFLINWSINDFEQKVIDNLKKDLGITLKPVTVSTELYQTKLTSMIASNDSPDLCVMLSTDFPMMPLKNKLQAIDTSIIDIKKDSELSLSTMDLFKWDDKYYGINCGGNWQGGPFFVYYNATLIKQKGYKTPLQLYKAGNWNWDTFEELAKNMTDKSKNYYGFGCESTVQVAFLSSIKTDFVKVSNGKMTNNLNDANLLKALSFVSNLKANGYMEPSLSGGKVDNRAMTLKGAWMLQKQFYDHCYGDDGEVVPVPCPKGQKQVVASQSRVISIVRGAKQTKAAHLAARYFVDPDSYNMNDQIKSKQMREMFYSASKSDNIYCGMGVGVAQYDDPQLYWDLLYLSEYSAADIPVKLKQHESVINGVIDKIKKDSALFN